MQRLDAGDLERVGRFVAEVGAIEGDEPFPPAFLAALQRLVPCDSVTFCELDRIGERELGVMTIPDVPDAERELALDYWQARHDHPICHYHETTGDWRAYRLSDFVEMRRVPLPAGSTPSGFDPQRVAEPDHGRPRRPLSHTKVFLLARSGGRDFDASDCLLLDVLRPYFAMRYEAARSPRRTVSDESGACSALTRENARSSRLSPRARRTQRSPSELWIARGTVRRHLENAYAKLGVHTRTAAVRAVSPRRVATSPRDALGASASGSGRSLALDLLWF